MNRGYVISIIIFIFIVIATLVVIGIGKGYRFGLDSGKIELSGTGILVAKSMPDTAQVFLNGHLTTATNNTLNLAPKEYDVKIFKEGYFPWEKKITVSKEQVSTANALLFPTAPALENITDIGVSQAVIDPSMTKIAFTVASQSAKKNGIYILDMTSRPILTLQSSSSQIVDNSTDLFSEAKMSWSPDGKQLLATVSADLNDNTYLLDVDRMNVTPTNVTEVLANATANFAKQTQAVQKARISSLSKKVRSFAANNFTIMSWSPDQTKILYKASQSATMPIFITPRILGVNSTVEDRNLNKDEIYVYDIKEDRNYKLDSADFSQSYSWYPDSGHILFVKDKKLQVMEYDGLNKITFYAGPFIDSYAFPWPDGTKIVILTNLGNANSTPNLYTISLK